MLSATGMASCVATGDSLARAAASMLAETECVWTSTVGRAAETVSFDVGRGSEPAKLPADVLARMTKADRTMELFGFWRGDCRPPARVAPDLENDLIEGLRRGEMTCDFDALSRRLVVTRLGDGFMITQVEHAHFSRTASQVFVSGVDLARPVDALTSDQTRALHALHRMLSEPSASGNDFVADERFARSPDRAEAEPATSSCQGS